MLSIELVLGVVCFVVEDVVVVVVVVLVVVVVVVSTPWMGCGMTMVVELVLG